MNNLTRFFTRYRRRTWLLGLVVLLLLGNLGRWLQANYAAEVAALESRQAILARYQLSTANAEELRSRLTRLQASRKKLEPSLFHGGNEEEIISAMQLNLQALVSTAGLESESIRPMQQRSGRGADDGKAASGLGEVVIKARLQGTLSEYLELLALLAQSEKFFKIENFSLSPYKRVGLKITLDLRGYFVQLPPAAGGGDGGVDAGTPAE